MIDTVSGKSSGMAKNAVPPSVRNGIIFGLALWVLCFLLANLEVQIEGPNGWAAKLPTWRTLDPSITWIFGGKPVTGYHVYLNLMLLAFFHFPFVFTNFSWKKEARLISGYVLLTVVWDFLWFVVNPYFGTQRYSAENIWWFKHWFFGFPIDYYFGIVVSLIIMIAPGFRSRRESGKLAAAWAVQFAVLLGLTVMVVLIY
jgi:hypothetical protein